MAFNGAPRSTFIVNGRHRDMRTHLSLMADWYLTIKTIKGRPYLYRQRTWREHGRVRSQSQYIGPIDLTAAGVAPIVDRPRPPKRSRAYDVAMAVFGVEDEYGERVDSLWNRYINKGPKAEAEPQKESTKIAEGVEIESGFTSPDNAAGESSTGSASHSSAASGN